MGKVVASMNKIRLAAMNPRQKRSGIILDPTSSESYAGHGGKRVKMSVDLGAFVEVVERTDLRNSQ
jgi:hypothetical protein